MTFPVQMACLLLKPFFESAGRVDRSFDVTSVMNQNLIVLCLNLNWVFSEAVRHDLAAALGSETPAHSTVARYVRMARLDPAKDPLNCEVSLSHLGHSDKGIMAILEEKSFSSVQQSA
jgi:hypothetical protein